MGIREEFMALKGADGKIRVDEVERWATRNPDSEIARRLEWDDKIAAVYYRQGQIRELMRFYVVDDNRQPLMVSLSIDRQNGGGYRELYDVFREPDLLTVLTQDLLAEMARLERRFARIESARVLWEATERIREQELARAEKAKNKVPQKPGKRPSESRVAAAQKAMVERRTGRKPEPAAKPVKTVKPSKGKRDKKR